MPDPSFFNGPERLEPFPPTQHPMRMGAPDPLNVPDRKRIETALAEQNGGQAIAYLQAIGASHQMILGGFVEWCLRITPVLAAKTSPQQERAIARKAHAQWKQDCRSLKADDLSGQTLEWLTGLLHPERITPAAVETHLKNLQAGKENPMPMVVGKIAQLHDSITGAVRAAEFEAASRHLDDYWKTCLTLHDALTQYITTVGAVVADELGQKISESVNHGGFASCSFYEGFFQLMGALSPEQLAAFLAEHLRGHFSGAGRGGAVQIVDEENRYRLVFDACGSGGAMRQRALKGGTGPATNAEASPATWNRKNEVPSFCSHCAFNELAFVERQGYPAWVTEFDPDASKPCGWTIYKNPDLIPEYYFSRLGLKKDPSHFQKKPV